jgi:hypothetical protein
VVVLTGLRVHTHALESILRSPGIVLPDHDLSSLLYVAKSLSVKLIRFFFWRSHLPISCLIMGVLTFTSIHSVSKTAILHLQDLERFHYGRTTLI